MAERAPPTCPLEVPVLQDTEDRLEQKDGADNEQTQDDVSVDRIREVAQVAGDLDTKSEAADHHDEADGLDRRVDGGDFLDEVGVAQPRDARDGEVDGDGAERVEHDKHDGHDAGVGIALAVEDLERVLRPAVESVSCL